MRSLLGILTLAMALSIPSISVSAQHTRPLDVQEIINCEGDTNGVVIRWSYSPKPSSGDPDEYYFLTPDGYVHANWLSTQRSDVRTEKTINRLSPDIYCELRELVLATLAEAPSTANCGTSNYILRYSDKSTGENRVACWRRTDRSDAISAYLRAFVRLNNTLPPDALD